MCLNERYQDSIISIETQYNKKKVDDLSNYLYYLMKMKQYNQFAEFNLTKGRKEKNEDQPIM